MIYTISVLAAIVIMALGELLKNETKDKYISKGYNWRNVIIYSNIAGVIMGLISAWSIDYLDISGKWNPEFIPFVVTITSYITMQSFMTDLRILLINRKVLRIAYISTYILSIYNVIANDLFRINWIALLVFTLLLMGIFILSSIGASDVRAMAVSMPFVISLGGYDAILLFIVTLLLIAVVVGARNLIRDRKRFSEFKQDNIETYNKMSKILFYKLARDLIRNEKTPEEMATPIGPYMVIPFLIFLMVFPFVIG